MKKKVPVVSAVSPEEASNLAGVRVEATVALADLAGTVKNSMLGFCADIGLMVMYQVMADVLTRRIGPKHARLPGRNANWHGSTTGSVVLGGRLVSVEGPRVRTTEGEEVSLDSWAVFSSRDLLDQLTAEQVLAGVATRRHVDIAEPLSADIEEKARATGRSSVSRRWVRATEAALAELMARDLSALEAAVLMVDGIEVAGQCCVAALVICADGTKVPVGLWLGRHREQDRRHRPALGPRLEGVTLRAGPARSHRRGQGLSLWDNQGLRFAELTSYLRHERPPGLGTTERFVVLRGPTAGDALSEAGVRSLFRRHRGELGCDAGAPSPFASHLWDRTSTPG